MSHALLAPASFELEAKKSRFLAQAANVDSPDAALAFLAQVAAREATHHCWAYRIGQQYRFSDDGEPAGTAGKPILAAIDGQGFDDTVVVVTRWYGGTKLGAGGLVRAYGGAAAECLRRAPRRERIAWRAFGVDLDFAQAGSVHALLAAHGAEKLDERYAADGLTLRVRLPAVHVAAFADALRDATRGRARLREEDAPLQ